MRPADQANTVQHWQLRDLIHAPDDEDSLFYVHGSKTRRLHTRTNEVSTSYSVSSLLHHGDGRRS